MATIAAILLLAAAPDGLATNSPYAGEQQRHIKALAPEEIEGLTQGHGMGLSMAAELNHYLGPRHVLDLADDMALTAAQGTQAARPADTATDRALPRTAGI
jgi:hypothetical protein